MSLYYFRICVSNDNRKWKTIKRFFSKGGAITKHLNSKGEWKFYKIKKFRVI